MINVWLRSAEQHGVARAQIGTVLDFFNRSRRTDKALEVIEGELAKYGLFVLNGYELREVRDLSSYVLMSRLPMHRDQMTACMDEDRLSRTITGNQEWAKRCLGLSGAGWSDLMVGNPLFWKGTRGRLDLHAFRVENDGAYEEFVAIELKSKEACGGFEQLNGYLYHLRQMDEMSGCRVRGILISGLEDIASHLSFSIFSSVGVDVGWFLYKCEKEEVSLESLRVRLPVSGIV